MFEKGINFIDTDFIKREHQGNGVYSNKLNLNGSKNKLGQIYFVRNCIFEPLSIYINFRLNALLSQSYTENSRTHGLTRIENNSGDNNNMSQYLLLKIIQFYKDGG